MIRQLLLTSTISLVLGSTAAFAQDTMVPNAADTTQAQPLQEKSATSDTAGVPFIVEQQEGQWFASEFIGQTVQNNDGQALGEVADLVFDKDGKAAGVIISSGGFLGMGERRIAVPLEAVDRSIDENGTAKLTLASDPENMQAAPVFMTLLEKQQEAEKQRLLQQSEQQNGIPTTGITDQ